MHEWAGILILQGYISLLSIKVLFSPFAQFEQEKFFFIYILKNKQYKSMGNKINIKKTTFFL